MPAEASAGVCTKHYAGRVDQAATPFQPLTVFACSLAAPFRQYVQAMRPAYLAPGQLLKGWWGQAGHGKSLHQRGLVGVPTIFSLLVYDHSMTLS